MDSWTELYTSAEGKSGRAGRGQVGYVANFRGRNVLSKGLKDVAWQRAGESI